jgi:RHS repeat-associated protein
MAAIARRPATSTSSGGGTSTTTTRYSLPDHLNSTNVVTNASGTPVETLDYYPYGGLRIDDKVGGNQGEKRKYIGQEYDSESGLNYLQARYQDPTRGQFLSEDPIFLGDPRQQTLTDPQSLNSYSYANDNPITRSDPSGLYSLFDNPTPQATQYWNSLYGSAAIMGQDPMWNYAFNHPVSTGLLVVGPTARSIGI